jgi:hypothetical protein
MATETTIIPAVTFLLPIIAGAPVLLWRRIDRRLQQGLPIPAAIGPSGGTIFTRVTEPYLDNPSFAAMLRPGQEYARGPVHPDQVDHIGPGDFGFRKSVLIRKVDVEDQRDAVHSDKQPR